MQDKEKLQKVNQMKNLNNDLDLLKFIENLGGSTITIPSINDNMQFIKASREQAKNHKFLFQCTKASALLSIIENKELWLTNLKLVNDKEEANRIDAPEYESSYYVGCFTYCNDISIEHWEEYGNIDDGVLFSVKQEGFQKDAIFMNSECKKETHNSFFEIYKNNNDARNEKISEQVNNHRIINPYYIFDFDFYQVVYDDKLKKDILGTSFTYYLGMKLHGQSFIPNVAGIIKNTKGTCTRNDNEPYTKEWISEKEVRLKVGIKPYLEPKEEWP